MQSFGVSSSHIDYCNSILYGINESSLNQLQSVMRASAPLVMRKSKFDDRTKHSICPASDKPKNQIQIVRVSIYKCMNSMARAPMQFSKVITLGSSVAGFSD